MGWVRDGGDLARHRAVARRRTIFKEGETNATGGVVVRERVDCQRAPGTNIVAAVSWMSSSMEGWDVMDDAHRKSRRRGENEQKWTGIPGKGLQTRKQRESAWQWS
jgi:hypothetical protein